MGAAKPLVLIPGAPDRLVWREAGRALETLGFPVASRDPAALPPRDLARILALPPERSNLPAHPGLFFSVNFLGLDKFGETFAILREKGIPAAVWCVDNPWNLLSGLRSDFWKDCRLFVTDPGFIPGLEAHGAKRVFFLPLGTDPDIFSPDRPGKGMNGQAGDAANPAAPLVFVGRSAFPGKERFFVGQEIPEDLLTKAASRLRDGQRPDFFWWLEELERTTGPAPLWPGSAARKAALGAEESSLAWRAACLKNAAPLGLAIYGDAGWAGEFPSRTPDREKPELFPPLDYYTQLAPVYASAPFSLNMTSFLLPQGLNQRHFDIWAAGGFCLMDDCRGLEIFPRELTRPVIFAKPEDVPVLVKAFTRDPAEKMRLAGKWRDFILAEHIYRNRMREMTDRIF